MAPTNLVPAQLSDGDLLAEVVRLAACERTATAALIALLAEVDARRLCLGEGCRLPVADGGPSTAANLELRCTSHHRRETERWFGFDDESGAALEDSARAESMRDGRDAG